MVQEPIIIEKKPRMTESGTYYMDYYHKKNEFITCECGCIIKRFYYLKHSKKPKHLANIEFNKTKSETKSENI